MNSGTDEARKTRQQLMLGLAADNIEEVKGQNLGKQYKAIAQNFPVLVRTCGLCQAVVFVKAKAAGNDDQARAYAKINQHAKSVLKQENLVSEGQDLTEAIIGFDTSKYARATRLLLAAWVYHKRFAEATFRN